MTDDVEVDFATVVLELNGEVYIEKRLRVWFRFDEVVLVFNVLEEYKGAVLFKVSDEE